jgi:hypothetical protein
MTIRTLITVPRVCFAMTASRRRRYFVGVFMPSLPAPAGQIALYSSEFGFQLVSQDDYERSFPFTKEHLTMHSLPEQAFMSALESYARFASVAELNVSRQTRDCRAYQQLRWSEAGAVV